MAGIWNTWTDKETDELHKSYTMVTLNADHHPLLNRMHRPDPERPATIQDKRAVVPLQASAFDVLLRGTIDEATAALVLPHVDDYAAGADGAPPAPPKAPEQQICCDKPPLRQAAAA